MIDAFTAQASHAWSEWLAQDVEIADDDDRQQWKTSDSSIDARAHGPYAQYSGI